MANPQPQPGPSGVAPQAPMAAQAAPIPQAASQQQGGRGSARAARDQGAPIPQPEPVSSEEEEEETPVVITTGSSSEEDLEELERAMVILKGEFLFFE